MTKPKPESTFLMYGRTLHRVLNRISRRRLSPIALLIPTMLLSCGSPGDNQNPVLTIEGGRIQGIRTESDITVYKGIPYAAPPVGANRWREPQSVAPWEGVKIADNFGNAAMQAAHREGEFYHKEFFDEGDAPYSEDCLTLNIWTPAPGRPEAKLPVAMWIHGGAYTGGWSFEKEMDGRVWAERGVVLVTINYRLGVFGFLAHPDLAAESPHGVAGNYGTLDQIAALEWIVRNIDRFGGDPNRITIFGQSAGGGAIKTLAASPLSRDLISGAIIQSAGGIDLSGAGGIGDGAYEASLAAGKALMDFGRYGSLDEMRAAPADEIFALQARYTSETGNRVRFAPTIDGYVSPENFSTAAINGRIANVPYMIGFVTGDVRMGALGAVQGITDFCTVRADAGGSAWAYQFARPLPGDDAGAYHSSELWYIFGTLERAWRPFVEDDYALSAIMADAWCNFAKYGNPDGGNAPLRAGRELWNPYTEADPRFMIFKLDEAGRASAKPGEPELPTAGN